MKQDTLIVYLMYTMENKQAMEEFLCSLPREALTQVVCEEGVLVSAKFAKRIPKEFMTHNVVRGIIQQTGIDFVRYVDSDRYDDNDIASALAKTCIHCGNEESLSRLPGLTYDLCLKAVDRFGLPCLPYLPEKFATADACLQILRKEPEGMYLDLQVGKFLLQVADKYNNDSLRLATIARRPELLKEIPYRQRTLEMNVAAATSKDGLDYVVKSQRTEEFWEKAAIASPLRIWSQMPVEMRTVELAEKAAWAAGERNEDLPRTLSDMLSKEFWQKLINAGRFAPSMISHLPKELQTDAICDHVLDNCIWMHAYIDDKFMTEERCLKLIDNVNTWPVNSNFEKFCTPRVFLRMIEKFPDTYPGEWVIPENLRDDPSIWTALLSASVSLHGHDTAEIFKLQVPDEFARDADFWMKAVQSDARIFTRVPDDLITQEMIETAVAKDGTLLRRVPFEKWTEELQSLAVKSGKIIFSDIRDNLLTPEICEKNVNEYNFTDIPERLRSKEVVLSMLNGISGKAADLAYINGNQLTACYEAIPAQVKNDPDVLLAMGKRIPHVISQEDIKKIFALPNADPGILRRILEEHSRSSRAKCDISAGDYFKATNRLDLINAIQPDKRMITVESYLNVEYPQNAAQDEQSYAPSM